MNFELSAEHKRVPGTARRFSSHKLAPLAYSWTIPLCDDEPAIGVGGEDMGTIRKGVKGKPIRAERNQMIKRRLFDAAVKVVGAHGYADASAARIAQEAEVSAGTLYNHFADRQELLDQLLPTVGDQLLEYIRREVDPGSNGEKKENDRLRAFFDFLRTMPEFVRILNEAEIFAPEGFHRHMANMVNGYKQSLIRARDRGELNQFSDNEVEALVYILLGARSYLSNCYLNGKGNQARSIPPYVLTAYEKLIRHGMFKVHRMEKASRSPPSRSRKG